MGTSSNVVVGLQSTNTIKIGAYGAIEAAAVDVGFIKGGVTFEKDETQYEVKVDQVLATIRKVTTNVSLKFKFSMAEATLANMARAFGLADSALVSSELSLGIPSGADVEKSAFINVKGPGPGTRKITLWKVRPTGKVSPAYKKDEETLFDVEMECLADVTQTAGQEFGLVDDVGADSTAPVIAMTTPASAGSVTAATKNTVLLSITEANLMDKNSIIYGDTVAIFLQGTPNALVAGSVVYDSTAKTITFTPTAVWGAGTYQVMVSTGLKDANGNHLAATFSGYFTAA